VPLQLESGQIELLSLTTLEPGESGINRLRTMGTNNLAETNPELAREWHPGLNGDLKPEQVSPASAKKVWWLGDCGHSFIALVDAGSLRGAGCSFCSGNKVLPGFNDLATTHPGVAREWHPELNGELNPAQVSRGSTKKVWWLGDCGHAYKQTIGNKTISGHGCSYCAGKKVLPGFNDLSTAFPKLALEWHPDRNGALRPERVTPSSSRSVWWLGACGHEWRAVVFERSSRNSGCSICAGKQIVEGFNDLTSTHPDIAKQWHPSKNRDLLPSQVIAGSHKSVWWLGACGHEWRAEIKSRALQGNGCSKCAVSGFSSTKPGVLYFIAHPAHRAFKVGITNTGSKSDRLKQFQRLGWIVIQTWESESGLEIQETEKHFFRWLRKEIKAPAMLGKAEMGAPAGASETFSDSILKKAEIVSKIQQLLTETKI